MRWETCNQILEGVILNGKRQKGDVNYLKSECEFGSSPMYAST